MLKGVLKHKSPRKGSNSRKEGVKYSALILYSSIGKTLHQLNKAKQKKWNGEVLGDQEIRGLSCASSGGRRKELRQGKNGTKKVSCMNFLLGSEIRLNVMGV